MPIEIQTLIQVLSEPTLQLAADRFLAEQLNNGWQIVTLTHHSETFDIREKLFSRVVTLQRELKGLHPVPPRNAWAMFMNGQSVMFSGEDDDNPMPLQYGDLGHVVSGKNEGDEAGVLFDRYDTVIYSRRVDGRNEPFHIFHFCVPAKEGQS